MMKPSDLPSIPEVPRSIQKGVPLKNILGTDAVDCLARNIQLVHPQFNGSSFRKESLSGLDELGFMPRGQHIADTMRQFLPDAYTDAIQILLDSLTPPQTEADEFGLAGFSISRTASLSPVTASTRKTTGDMIPSTFL